MSETHVNIVGVHTHTHTHTQNICILINNNKSVRDTGYINVQGVEV